MFTSEHFDNYLADVTKGVSPIANANSVKHQMLGRDGMQHIIQSRQSEFSSRMDGSSDLMLRASNSSLTNTRTKTDLLDNLRHQIRSVETVNRACEDERISSGVPAIDRLLPGNGYPRGSLIQWLTGGGQGADFLSLMLAREACQEGGALVVFDPFNEFYPPAAAAMGINLDHLIILKGAKDLPHASADPASAGPGYGLDSDLLWSIDQALRCPAVAAVWGPIQHIDERWFRRFQLSAESSGSLGLFVQPIQQVRQPSWAEVQWLVTSHRDLDSATGFHSSQNVHLQLTRCRGTHSGKSINLSINTITGNVQVARREHGELRRPVRKTQCNSQSGYQ